MLDKVLLTDLAKGQSIPLDLAFAGGFTPDGAYLYPTTARNMPFGPGLYYRDTGKLKRTLGEQEVRALAMAPDGATFVALDANSQTLVFDAKGHELSKTRHHREYAGQIAIAPDGRRALTGDQLGGLFLIELPTGKLVRKLGPSKLPVRSLTLSPDGALAASGSDGPVLLWEVASGKLLAQLVGHEGRVEAVRFSADGRLLVSAARDRTLKVWDLKGRLIATLLSASDGRDWLAFTPDGLLAGTEGAIRDLAYVVQQDRTQPVEAFFDCIYQPAVLAARAQGLDGAAALARAGGPKETGLRVGLEPPAATLTCARDAAGAPSIEDGILRLSLSATSAGGRVEGLRLLHNGKAAGERLRGLGKADAASPEALSAELAVELSDGDNRFTAVAWSEAGVESAKAELLVPWKRPAPRKPVLRALAIGADVYQNAQYNLNYAVADLRGFEAALRGAAGLLFGEMDVVVLQDAEATRAKVLDALAGLQARARPEDVLVVYYAGHGIALEGAAGAAKGDFFLILPAVTQMTDLDKAARFGVSGAELREQLSKIKATKQLLLLDACNSGALAQGLATRGSAEEGALARLGRATGSVILASTTAEQLAQEFGTLGHGVFTYALIEGLSGKAAAADGQITAGGLRTFLDARLPELTRQYKGQEQFPITRIWGQDFPLGMKP